MWLKAANFELTFSGSFSGLSVSDFMGAKKKTIIT